MRADRYAMRFRQLNGGPEDRRVAGVEARGQVCRGDRLHQTGIVTDGVSAKRFADVRIEVDAQREQCTKQKGTALLRCPSVHWPGSPSKSRHLAAIRPMIRGEERQASYRFRCRRKARDFAKRRTEV